MKSDAYLVSKYNVPGPRYTSYPTVPYWEGDSFSVSSWKESLKKGLSLPNDKGGLTISGKTTEYQPIHPSAIL